MKKIFFKKGTGSPLGYAKRVRPMRTTFCQLWCIDVQAYLLWRARVENDVMLLIIFLKGMLLINWEVGQVHS